MGTCQKQRALSRPLQRKQTGSPSFEGVPSFQHGLKSGFCLAIEFKAQPEPPPKTRWKPAKKQTTTSTGRVRIEKKRGGAENRLPEKPIPLGPRLARRQLSQGLLQRPRLRAMENHVDLPAFLAEK